MDKKKKLDMPDGGREAMLEKSKSDFDWTKKIPNFKSLSEEYIVRSFDENHKPENIILPRMSNKGTPTDLDRKVDIERVAQDSELLIKCTIG